MLGIFSKNKPTKEILSPRMLRWSLVLNAYDYTLIHRPGKKIQNADSLSRLPKETDKFEVPASFRGIVYRGFTRSSTSDSRDCKISIARSNFVKSTKLGSRGWPNEKPDKKFQTFFSKRNELSTHRNCLLWGNRVAIPVLGQSRVLQALHLGHPEIERMKALSRSYVWWLDRDYDIEVRVQRCQECQQTRHAPPNAPVHP
nr:uncharacterized protein LOC122272250 [Parasteatoda tepidariorum]